MARQSLFRLHQKIEIFDHADGQRYKCLIQEVDADTLSVTAPSRFGATMAFHPGDRLRVEFAVKDAFYSFETQVITRKKSNHVQLLVIVRPTQLARRQRRDYVRLDVLLPVSFHLISTSGESPVPQESDKFTGKTVDISGGGLQVVCSVKVARSDTALVKLKPEDDNPLSLSLAGIITWVDDDPVTRTVRFGVRFTEISEPDRERIIRFIFSKMRQRTLT